MRVKVKLFATLAKGRFGERGLELNASTTVLDVVNLVGVDSNDVALIFVNGRHSSFDYLLQEDDRLSLFPPIGGG
ncbi:MAG: MoaD/ThiS family protein [Deltaproteobacteria bacterium]|nr:MoaD/ThiS family protein [Deltaproteobacteria bacterium]